MEIQGIIQTERGTLVPQLDDGDDIVQLMADWLAQGNEYFDRKTFVAHAAKPGEPQR